MGINLDAKRVWLHKNYTVVRMQILDVDKLKMIRKGKGDQFADDFEVGKGDQFADDFEVGKATETSSRRTSR